ncbi:hypothetical protein BZG36_05215, partial [Bifiguratus adelaidae]
MSTLATTVILTALGVQQIAAQSGPGCCSAWWFAPSGSVMTKGLHYVWPGENPSKLEPRFCNLTTSPEIGMESAFSRTLWVISNNLENGHLRLGTGHIMMSDYHEYNQVLVYEGNALTTDFELDTNSGEWIDNWTLEPGEAGAAAGTKSDSGR